MILRIRNSYIGKTMSVFMVFVMGVTLINPLNSYGLTGGPAQPEFNSFTPIGTSDMVDLSSGDFSYNLPLMDIGGFPINLAYQSGVTMDQEASWVGLGWNLSIGQINRQMRGLPDDFEGDEMVYENNMKPNVTVGANVGLAAALAGVHVPSVGVQDPLTLNMGLAAKYNSYTGFSLSPSAGITYEISDNLSAGLSVQSDENGLTVSPNVSLQAKMRSSSVRDYTMGANVGLTFNSRQGLSKVNMSASLKAKEFSYKNNSFERVGGGSLGSSVSYVDNTYTPQVSDNTFSQNATFNASLGSEIIMIEGQVQIGAFKSVQYIPTENKHREEEAFGYDNTHLATEEGVKDFNREKDGNFSVNSTNLPLTNYTYDLYSIKGQGVGGMFRPYRSQIGYVNDKETTTMGIGASLGGELGMGNAIHAGFDFELTETENRSGVWNEDNDALIEFESTPGSNLAYEEVYFKNVGDLGQDEEIDMYGTAQTKLGAHSPIRVSIEGGSKFDRRTNKEYEIKRDDSIDTITTTFTNANLKRTERVKRNQTIQKIRADEVTVGGADLLGFVKNTHAEDHHTAGFIITRNDGARYIYGDALYNTKKEEVTFAAEGLTANCTQGTVTFGGSDNTPNNSRGDQYFNRVTTPAYAHTYLLTTLLSVDYSDVDGNGPSDNDLGSYTTFKYTTAANYHWRVPYESNKANFNEGIKTDPADDKASYISGEKETKYIDEIETKTHIAKFHTSTRNDGQGSGVGTMKKLDKISLYSKEEYYDPVSGLPVANPVPIKEVHFEYSYDLCPGIPNNTSGGGKLTLEKVYFTYRNSSMGKHSDYEFTYNSFNPAYNLKGYDIWGNYKRNPQSTCTYNDSISVPEYNYVEQYDPNIDNNVSAWSLTEIELPSGGTIKVEYESDDYQYVQDKKAMQMFKVTGAGVNSTTASPDDDLLYSTGSGDARFLYIELPTEDAGITYAEFRDKYLNEIITEQKGLVYFRFMLNTNKEGGKNSIASGATFDYVTGYFELLDGGAVFTDNGTDYASVEMKLVNLEGGFNGSTDINPIAKAGWNFGRKYVPQYIYGLPGYQGSADADVVVDAIMQAQDNLLEIFKGPNGVLRDKKIARRFIPEKSWIRLGNPNKHKKGGGCRVKKLEMYDDWDDMTQTPGREQNYGQEYSYDLEDGTSSGVATYEPIGGKENPFVQPVFVNVKRILAPDEENYTEKPFGESFFPSPKVTYSRVSVKNLERIDIPNNRVVKKHATGHVVTEFYTSKDYPTLVDQTTLRLHEDKSGFLSGLLNISSKKYLTLSQGYVVHVNDMDGKKKAEFVYAEGQDDFISGAEYRYDGFTPSSGNISPNLISQNKGNLNNEVLTLTPEGKLDVGTIGVEYDIINDFREKKTRTEVAGVNTNLATFLAGIIPGIVPVPLPDYALHRDQLRMVSTTKVINTFGIQREIIAHDAGASVKTRNLVWDSETGEVLVTETVNEFNDKYYTLNLPAHWYYKGMDMAFRNSGIEFIGGSPAGNEYTNGAASGYINNGDEVIYETVLNPSDWEQGWLHEVNGGDFKLIDIDGVNITDDIDTVKVIRSGRRNIQATSMGSVVMMKNPIDLIGIGSTIPINFLETTNWDDLRIVNAGAVEFSDDWDILCECGLGGNNPYVQNEKGVWRAKTSHLYLTKRRQTNKRTTAGTDEINPRNDGFYETFTPFYRLNGSNWQIHPNALTAWTHTSEVTEFSPYGFELENKDALERYSAAQYGYNFKFPMAVSANSKYSQMGFDGFEDYGFDGCTANEHFGYRGMPGLMLSENESHTGRFSLEVPANGSIGRTYGTDNNECAGSYDCGSFVPRESGVTMTYWVSAWVKVDEPNQVKTYASTGTTDDAHIEIEVDFGLSSNVVNLYPTGKIIDGWQRIAGSVEVPQTACSVRIEAHADLNNVSFFDDIRMHPFNGSMKSYVYDAETFWLTAELDDNNYATFYEYDQEGGLVRIKKETARGVVTIQETRSNSVKQ